MPILKTWHIFTSLLIWLLFISPNRVHRPKPLAKRLISLQWIFSSNNGNKNACITGLTTLHVGMASLDHIDITHNVHGQRLVPVWLLRVQSWATKTKGKLSNCIHRARRELICGYMHGFEWTRMCTAQTPASVALMIWTVTDNSSLLWFIYDK